MSQDNFNTEEICKTKRRLEDAVESLVVCSGAHDITGYSAGSAFFIVSVRNSNLPAALKREIVQLIDLHDLLFIGIILIDLTEKWNETLAKNLRSWAVKISNMVLQMNTEGDPEIRDRVDELLPNPEVRTAYYDASVYANSLRWASNESFREGIPTTFSHTIKMTNAHKYFEPMDDTFDVANLDALQDRFQAHLSEIQAKLKQAMLC
ncbi:MAG: hypothetical protein ACOYLB_02205 [Phototrophicaceae bacterium]